MHLSLNVLKGIKISLKNIPTLNPVCYILCLAQLIVCYELLIFSSFWNNLETLWKVVPLALKDIFNFTYFSMPEIHRLKCNPFKYLSVHYW